MESEYESGVSFGREIYEHSGGLADRVFIKDLIAAYEDVATPIAIPLELASGAAYGQFLKFLQVVNYPADEGKTFLRGVNEGAKGLVHATIGDEYGSSSSSSSSSRLNIKDLEAAAEDRLQTRNITSASSFHGAAEYRDHLFEKLQKTIENFSNDDATTFEDLSTCIAIMRRHTQQYLQTRWPKEYTTGLVKYESAWKFANELIYKHGVDTFTLDTNDEFMTNNDGTNFDLIKALIANLPELHTLNIVLASRELSFIGFVRYICAVAPNIRHIVLTVDGSKVATSTEGFQSFTAFVHDFTTQLVKSVHMSAQISSMKIIYKQPEHFAAIEASLKIIDEHLFIDRPAGDLIRPYPFISQVHVDVVAGDETKKAFFRNLFKQPEHWRITAYNGENDLQDMHTHRALAAFEYLEHLHINVERFTRPLLQWFSKTHLNTVHINGMSTKNFTEAVDATSPQSAFQLLVALHPKTLRILSLFVLARDKIEIPPEFQPVFPADTDLQRFTCVSSYRKKPLFPEFTARTQDLLMRSITTNTSLLTTLLEAIDPTSTDRLTTLRRFIPPPVARTSSSSSSSSSSNSYRTIREDEMEEAKAALDRLNAQQAASSVPVRQETEEERRTRHRITLQPTTPYEVTNRRSISLRMPDDADFGSEQTWTPVATTSQASSSVRDDNEEASSSGEDSENDYTRDDEHLYRTMTSEEAAAGWAALDRREAYLDEAENYHEPTMYTMAKRIFGLTDANDHIGARGSSHSHPPSAAKAREMLANPPHGHPLTERQRRYFEGLAHGWHPTH